MHASYHNPPYGLFAVVTFIPQARRNSKGIFGDHLAAEA
jgi:hypothetical protein